MISVIDCFDVFHKHIKKTKGEEQCILPFIDLIVTGIEIDIIDRGSLETVILHIDVNGTLMICKEQKNCHSRSIPFNNIECVLNEEYVTLFDITNNETFCKLRFKLEKSADIFFRKYNYLVNKFNKYKKLPDVKNKYIKLD